MDIAVIGVGNVGKALAGASVRAGHAVTLSSTNPDEARDVAQQLGGRAAASNRAAIQGAEVVILAVPFDAVPSILQDAGGLLQGKILVDVTNRMNPQDPGGVIDGASNAEAIQSLVPGVPVIKAFNTVFAARQADPVVDGIQLDGFVAGDDAAAKARVLDLVESLGFRPIDVGPLPMARALEATGWLNIWLNIKYEWVWQDGWKLVGPTSA
jgi:8-hydroxy-5-deazaflavin:NADPH oxidoreductase